MTSLHKRLTKLRIECSAFEIVVALLENCDDTTDEAQDIVNALLETQAVCEVVRALKNTTDERRKEADDDRQLAIETALVAVLSKCAADCDAIESA